MTTATLPKPKASLLKISPYAPGKSKANADRIIKLASNENPLGPSQNAIEALEASASQLHRYPDGSCIKLREAIAAVYNIPAGQIVCGAGSDELINLLIHSYAGEGDEVLYSEHGFLMYKIYALAHGATPVTAPETDLTASVDALLAAVTPKTKLVFLANPNNPTGTYLSASEVNRLRDGLPEDVLLVLDAAYAEYVAQDDYEAGKKLVEKTENTVMLRTFSKIYGLPALRLGWAYAPESVVDVLNRVRSPFNVSAAAQAAGIAAINDQEYVQHCVETNRKERSRVAEACQTLGLKVTPSEGNFLLVHFPESGNTAKAANEHLMGEGIIPREVAAYGLPNCLRITIGTDEENGILIESLQRFMA